MSDSPRFDVSVILPFGDDEEAVGIAVKRTAEHLRGLGVPRLVLTTRDAHAVYASVGFVPLRVPQTWMEIDVRTTRPDPSDVVLCG